jgi:cytidylate kinase
MEKRIQTIKQQLRQTKEEFHADIDLRREAQDLIQTRDEASRDYLQEYYHVDWADPSLYHLVLNTSRLTIEEAAQMIASLVRIFEAEHRADAQPAAA